MEHIWGQEGTFGWWSLLVLFYLYCQLIASIIRNDKLGQFILYNINIVQKIGIKYFKLTFISFDILLLIKFNFFGKLQIYLLSWDNFSEPNVTKSRQGTSSSFRMLIKMSTRVLIVNCLLASASNSAMSMQAIYCILQRETFCNCFICAFCFNC